MSFPKSDSLDVLAIAPESVSRRYRSPGRVFRVRCRGCSEEYFSSRYSITRNRYGCQGCAQKKLYASGRLFQVPKPKPTSHGFEVLELVPTSRRPAFAHSAAVYRVRCKGCGEEYLRLRRGILTNRHGCKACRNHKRTVAA
jgi:formylmethanofuran dehydrogenase subunit E